MTDIWGIVPPTGTVLSNSAMTTGSFAGGNILTSGATWLTIIFRLRATVTAADMQFAAAVLFDGFGNNTGLAVNTATALAPTSNGVDVYAYNAYDLRGLQLVRAQMKNNNAGTLNADITYFLK